VEVLSSSEAVIRPEPSEAGQILVYLNCTLETAATPLRMPRDEEMEPARTAFIVTKSLLP